MSLLEDTPLCGRRRIERLLGRGGMSDVLKASVMQCAFSAPAVLQRYGSQQDGRIVSLVCYQPGGPPLCVIPAWRIPLPSINAASSA
jgi:hypothetical protein